MAVDLPGTQLIRVRVSPGRMSAFESMIYVRCRAEALECFLHGAHIDVHLPTGLVRSYSLANSPAEGHRYRIAVALAEAGQWRIPSYS